MPSCWRSCGARAASGIDTLWREVRCCRWVPEGAVQENRVRSGPRSLAQGIGEALGEQLVYDRMGQLVTGTLMDYPVPVASALPSFAIGHLETPSPHTPGGVKGMGEGGTVGAPAAIANAVADALRPLGVSVTSLPVLPEALSRRARSRSPSAPTTPPSSAS